MSKISTTEFVGNLEAIKYLFKVGIQKIWLI